MKKGIGYTVLGVAIVVSVVFMLLFVFSGERMDIAEEEAQVVLEGTWKVAAQITNGSTRLTDSEYIVFRGNSVSYYRNDEDEPYTTSEFELASGSTYPNQNLILTNMSRTYTLTPITDNYIRLYESNSVYMELIRYANSDRDDLDFEPSLINGKWNVVYRNTAEIISNEQLEFVDGMLYDYRNGMKDPAAISAYSWKNGNCISVEALGVEMICYPLSKDVVFFVETSTGYIWELSRAA